jgi:galactose mutarotase-like enzyme
VSVVVEASKEFRFVLNFSPPSRQVLSPVVSTCAPNAFNLAGSGDSGTGMIELAPEQSWHGWVRITFLSAIDAP